MLKKPPVLTQYFVNSRHSCGTLTTEDDFRFDQAAASSRRSALVRRGQLYTKKERLTLQRERCLTARSAASRTWAVCPT